MENRLKEAKFEFLASHLFPIQFQISGKKQFSKEKLYRARAHGNPLNDTVFDVLACPDDVDFQRGVRRWVSQVLECGLRIWRTDLR